MHYKQIAKLTTNYKGEIETNYYEWIFVLQKISSNEKQAYIYDKELKIYLESPSSIIETYEVQFFNIKLKLCKRLQKSENFNRKLFYRYDWIRLKVNSIGQIVSVENKEELKQTWAKLKSKMRMDHRGNYVNQYLGRLSEM